MRKAVDDLGANVSMMVDTRGIEIRTGLLENGAAVLVPGQDFALRTDPGQRGTRAVCR